MALTEDASIGHWLRGKVRGGARRLRASAVRHGLPPARVGYRHVEPEPVKAHVKRMRDRGVSSAQYEVIYPEKRAANALPVNMTDRSQLPDDAGWWGYSMRDVPTRISTETFIATIPDAKIITFTDDKKEFWPAILSNKETAINLREIVFRDGHAAAMRQYKAANVSPQHFGKATWILERVYDNHSHWLTAHLPKLCLLQRRGELENVLMPEKLKGAMEASMRMMGLDPGAFRTFDPARPIAVDELTILGTDRFRPEMLRPVREAIVGTAHKTAPSRRIYISRSKARFRILRNEEEIWPLFKAEGFERVWMEDMSFPEQVKLMSEAAVVAGPHGAGLTNMMFCPEGTHIIEIAYLGFPNPNFYAVAAAMGHGYSLIAAEASGDVPPLEQDLSVDLEAVREALADFPDAPLKTPAVTTG